MRAALSVTRTTSRRTASSRSRIGTASRQIPTTPWTRPSMEIGRNSRTTVGVPRSPGAASEASGRVDRGLRRAAQRVGERRPDRGAGTGQARVVGDDDRAVGSADLDPDDLARAGQGREPSFELRSTVALRRRRWVEVRRSNVSVDEGTDRGRVAADDVVERRGREMRPDEDGLGRRRDPDDRQEDAQDEHEQERAMRASTSARRTRSMRSTYGRRRSIRS